MTNAVTVAVYDDSDNYVPLRYVRDVSYDSLYSGGFGTCSFFVPELRQNNAVRLGFRVVVRSGLMAVWDGIITNLVRDSSDLQNGIVVTATGYWGAVLNRREWAKVWSDTRVGPAAWEYRTQSSGDGLGEVRREFDRIQFLPDGGKAWATDQAIAVQYKAPDGETWERITFDFDLQEGAQAWELSVEDLDNSNVEWNTTTSGTGSQDITITTPTTTVLLIFRSKANQTPAVGIYGEFSSVTIYSETGDIDLTAVAEDVANYVSELNSTSNIADVGVDLTPFSFPEGETVASILAQAAAYGNASFSTYAYGVRMASPVQLVDPQLFVEQWPDTTDYEYAINYTDTNLVSGLSFVRSFAELANYVRVRYLDSNDVAQLVTPDDNANLKDTESIAGWGRHDRTITLQRTTDETSAVQVGRRYLAEFAEPQWRLSAPIRVRGAIRTSNGGLAPVSRIQAGERIRVTSDVATADSLILVLTRVRYDDRTETATLEVGRPKTFDVLLAQQGKGIA